eukprot:NODE_6590_length_1657_cov_6.218954.p1 GENE.NODE_6590_length_1657_cov_6.218954~~NODE_6590_length_1657_cov_6.218954.p1  ORF type:complete len:492 (+),score=121.73 NODE_6590_length_1657_cov_6.218954:98-1573(+)
MLARQPMAVVAPTQTSAMPRQVTATVQTPRLAAAPAAATLRPAPMQPGAAMVVQSSPSTRQVFAPAVQSVTTTGFVHSVPGAALAQPVTKTLPASAATPFAPTPGVVVVPGSMAKPMPTPAVVGAAATTTPVLPGAAAATTTVLPVTGAMKTAVLPAVGSTTTLSFAARGVPAVLPAARITPIAAVAAAPMSASTATTVLRVAGPVTTVLPATTTSATTASTTMAPTLAPTGAVCVAGAAGAAQAAGTADVATPPTIQSTKTSFPNPKCLSTKFNFDGDFKVNNLPLLLTVDPISSTRACHVTGLRVWDGGIVLSKYLEHYAPQVSHGRKLRGLELGCGSGVASLGFALMGHDVMLSDIAGMQAEATELNITRNAPQIQEAGGSATFEVLDWKELPKDRERYGRFDLVFASDVIWHQHFVALFVDALDWAAKGPGIGEILLSHKVRDAESMEEFEALIQQKGWVLERKVESEKAIGEDGHPLVHIYHVKIP